MIMFHINLPGCIPFNRDVQTSKSLLSNLSFNAQPKMLMLSRFLASENVIDGMGENGPWIFF